MTAHVPAESAPAAEPPFADDRAGRVPPSRSLAGKVVVVTGAARGLGAALAVKLAQRGAELALIGLEADELARAAAACDQVNPRAAVGRAHTWHADVTDRARMAAVAADVAALFGGVDVVVANAGIALGGPAADADPDAFDRVIEVNLLGSIATARAFLPALVRSRGYLLQIASLAAIAPAPLMAAYCASKSGVEAFAHCLRGEVAHQGVRVGVAYLTWTDTDMVRAADEDPVLREMRARLPWPANKTAPLEPAASRIAQGIERRKSHVYAQPWIRPLQWLPRAAVPAAVALRGPKEVARLAPRLDATSHLRRRPLGPGGRAAGTRSQRAEGSE
ncbi:SDR family oxidoreductase [Actinocrinis puniceicyclus]|uniref:SDR family oxidoreductase n=1 Tax=Actinocrinis puniceicyclus TaxID=977794 RepID=A0A8J7WT50_9ACTN|nr:SDR family oxidoreductase [Actinocrinis puniceicyclus]MBS2966012.1 SDR family oxidoreductase [Actinocrinis puniceicyclus]